MLAVQGENHLVVEAVQANASDIHIEPEEKFVGVQFRKHLGVLGLRDELGVSPKLPGHPDVVADRHLLDRFLAAPVGLFRLFCVGTVQADRFEVPEAKIVEQGKPAEAGRRSAMHDRGIAEILQDHRALLRADAGMVAQDLESGAGNVRPRCRMAHRGDQEQDPAVRRIDPLGDVIARVEQKAGPRHDALTERDSVRGLADHDLVRLR